MWQDRRGALFEIPLSGFPFQIEFFDKCGIPKNNTHLIVQRITFEEEIP